MQNVGALMLDRPRSKQAGPSDSDKTTKPLSLDDVSVWSCRLEKFIEKKHAHDPQAARKRAKRNFAEKLNAESESGIFRDMQTGKILRSQRSSSQIGLLQIWQRCRPWITL